MISEFLELLACPTHGESQRLRLNDQPSADLPEGAVECPVCGILFEIQSGILRSRIMLASAISEIKTIEMHQRDLDYANASTHRLDRDRIAEFDAIRKAVANHRGGVVLDAGCGAGHMSDALAGAARGAGIDFSFAGLTNFKCKSIPRMNLIQGDVCQPYFKSEAFDAIISSQVLEHIPSSEERLAFLSNLSQALKGTGRCVITVYNWDVGRRSMSIPKEGNHDSGIFYHCYTAEELRGELSRYFDVESIWGVNNYLPKTFRMVDLMGDYVYLWDRIWRRTRISHRYGKLLLAICRRKAEDCVNTAVRARTDGSA